MINCRTTQNRLGLYVDEELQERDRVSIETHLAGCPDCRQELESIKAIGPALATLKVPPLPSFSCTRIMVRAGKQRCLSRSFPPFRVGRMCPLRWMPAMALVCGLVIGSVMGLSIYAPFQGPASLVAELGPAQQTCMGELLYGLNDWSPMDRGGIESVTLAVMEN